LHALTETERLVPNGRARIVLNCDLKRLGRAFPFNRGADKNSRLHISILSCVVARRRVSDGIFGMKAF
jgi:hypothetical protein